MQVPRCSSKWLVPLALAVLGCQPEIGDACQLHTDCSSSGDRVCDPTMKGGYCTIFNCEPGSCPEEAVCVAYQTVPAAEAACSDTAAGARLTRTFCMRSCTSEGDCRSGYSCVDLSEDNPWGAEVVEKGSRNRKICTIPASVPEGPLPADAGGGPNETEVCDPPMASFPDASTPAVPDASEDGGPDGAAGAPGEAGTGGRDAASDASDASDASSGGAPGAGGIPNLDGGAGGAPVLDAGAGGASGAGGAGGTGGPDAAFDAQGDR